MSSSNIIIAIVAVAVVATAGAVGFVVMSNNADESGITIVYELNGGTNDADNPSELSSGAFSLKDPSRQHYTFDGWYSDSAFTTKISSIDASGNDVTIFAKWTPIQYDIAYVLGTNDAENPNPDKFTTDSVTLQNPSRQHYEFDGWYSESTFTNKVTALNRTGEQTVYAKWTPIPYSIAYVLGSNDVTNPNPNQFDSDTFVLQDADRPYYDFGGWYTENTFVNNVTILNRTSEQTVYAKWTPTTYSITYNLDGGTNAQSNPATYNVESSTIPLADPERGHYDFLGWYGDSQFTGNPITSLTSGSNGNVSLFAKWEPTKYTITYNLHDGVNAQSNPEFFTFFSEDVVFESPKKEHYDFGGWYSNYMFEGDAIAGVPSGSDQPIILFAKWTLTSYTIQYVLNDDEAVYFNNPVSGTIEDVLTINEPFRMDLAFDGWYTTPNFDPNTRVGTQFTPQSNTTMYAKWNDLVGKTLTYYVDVVIDEDHYLILTFFGYCAYNGGQYLTVRYDDSLITSYHGKMDSYTLQSRWMDSGIGEGEYLSVETISTALGDVETVVCSHGDETQWIGHDGLAYKITGEGYAAGLYSFDTFEPDVGEATITVTASEGIASVSGAGTYNIGDTVTLTVTMEEGKEFRGYSIDGNFTVARDLTFEFVAFESIDLFALAKDYYGVYCDNEESTHTEWEVIDDKTGITVFETDVDRSCFLLNGSDSYTLTTTYTIGGEEVVEKTDIIKSLMFIKMWFWTDNGFNGISFVGYTPDYAYFKNLNADSRSEIDEEDVTSFVTYTDRGIIDFKNQFVKETEGMSDLERANYVLGFVQQNIAYVSDMEGKGVEEYWKYPFETLFEERGDCEDQSILYAAIMKSLGYDVALLIMPGHMAVGLAGIEGASGSGFEADEKLYLYCETTATGWKVGMKPDEYTEAMVFVIE